MFLYRNSFFNILNSQNEPINNKKNQGKFKELEEIRRCEAGETVCSSFYIFLPALCVEHVWYKKLQQPSTSSVILCFPFSSVIPNSSHSFCFLLRVIDIHSNCHHSPSETSLFPQFWAVLRRAILSPKNDRKEGLKEVRQFVMLPQQNDCRLNLWQHWAT